jgi:ATP phosphoribosyltransferase
MRREAPPRIGLPKGRLRRYTLFSLEALGAAAVATDRMQVQSPAGPVEVWMLKARDIPFLVRDGMLDAGLAPIEWIVEAGDSIQAVETVEWYPARICLIAPTAFDLGEAKRHGARIVTEYPALTKAFCERAGIPGEVVRVHGSSEAMVPGLADAAVETVETGVMSKAYGLKEHAVVRDSTPIQAIVGPKSQLSHELVEALRAAALAPTERLPRDLVDTLEVAGGARSG